MGGGRHGVVRPRGVFRPGRLRCRRSRSSTARRWPSRWRRRLRSALVGAADLRLVLRAAVRRLSRDADARVRADRVVDRVPVGRGHRRLERHGRRSGRPPLLADKRDYFWFVLVLAGAALAAIAWLAQTPLGYALRGSRDSALRAEALGIDVRRTQWMAFAIAGTFAGLAGGLHVFSKGSLSPETLAIPALDRRAGDGAAGRRQTPIAGPLVGAAVFTLAAGWDRARDRLLARGARCRDPADRPAGADGHRRRAASALFARGAR